MKKKRGTKLQKSASQKMGIKENYKSFFVNPDDEAVENMLLPSLNISKKPVGEYDYIHLFVKTQADFLSHFPKLKIHLKPNGTL